jgi:hypothetical protein
MATIEVENGIAHYVARSSVASAGLIVGLFTLSLWLCRQFPALMGRYEGCLALGPLLGVLGVLGAPDLGVVGLLPLPMHRPCDWCAKTAH